MTKHHCGNELLCPVCDRKQIVKLASELIEKRGKRGGRIAAKNMSPEERRERAKKAAQARWKTQKG